MTSRLRKIARRVRGWLQQAPWVGTFSGAISLTDEAAAATVLGRYEIFERRTVRSSYENATPQHDVLEYQAKRAWLLRDVVCWPYFGAVIDGQRRLIRESVLDPRRIPALVENAFFRKYPITDCDVPTAVFQAGPQYDNHYHWLVDSIPRLYALFDRRLREIAKLRLLVCGTLTPDRRRLLEAMVPENVEIVQVPEKTRIRAKEFVLLPFLAQDCAAYFPQEYLQFFRERAFRAFQVSPATTTCGRILISRRNAVTRRCLNEDELEGQLAKHGFEAVQLEKLTFAEQIGLFAGAEIVVGTHGAGLTNLLFAGRCRVLEIFSSRAKFHYRHLATGMGQEYANVVGAEESKNAAFRVCVPEVLEKLSQWKAI